MKKIDRINSYSLLFLLSIVSCFESEKTKVSPNEEGTFTHADSLIFNQGLMKNFESMRSLTDSLEAAGEISALSANRWRGVAHYREGNYRMAEICYRKALDCPVNSEQDQLNYNKSARRLSELLLVKDDFEGSLRVAIPALKRMEDSGTGSDIDYAILLTNIGCCQLNLGQDDEANSSFLNAREHYTNRWSTDSTSRGLQEAIIGTIYTGQAYINTRRYAESIYWIDRTELLLNNYREKTDARAEYFDEYQGHIEIMRAVAMQGMGKPEEAARAYQTFLKTEYSNTYAGHIKANDYLLAARRYSEAADNYSFLDKALDDWGMEVSLDNIQLFLLPKYSANVKAGRRDSARVTGEHILAILDSAITVFKNSSTAELATLYDTNQKEARIVQQQMEIDNLRTWTIFVIIALAVVFLIYYSVHKTRQSKILAEKNLQLSNANSQIEELSRMKTELLKKMMQNETDMEPAKKRFSVFISYSRANLETVNKIKQTIEESTNVNCWMDVEGIESGEPRFTKSIIEGIEKCDVFIFMRSMQSQNSKYALLELRYATEESKKHVVILNIDDSEMTKEFKFLYGLTDMIFWNNKPQREKFIRDIKKWGNTSRV